MAWLQGLSKYFGASQKAETPELRRNCKGAMGVPVGDYVGIALRKHHFSKRCERKLGVGCRTFQGEMMRVVPRTTGKEGLTEALLSGEEPHSNAQELKQTQKTATYVEV